MPKEKKKFNGLRAVRVSKTIGEEAAKTEKEKERNASEKSFEMEKTAVSSFEGPTISNKGNQSSTANRQIESAARRPIRQLFDPSTGEIPGGRISPAPSVCETNPGEMAVSKSLSTEMGKSTTFSSHRSNRKRNFSPFNRAKCRNRMYELVDIIKSVGFLLPNAHFNINSNDCDKEKEKHRTGINHVAPHERCRSAEQLSTWAAALYRRQSVHGSPFFASVEFNYWATPLTTIIKLNDIYLKYLGVKSNGSFFM